MCFYCFIRCLFSNLKIYYKKSTEYIFFSKRPKSEQKKRWYWQWEWLLRLHPCNFQKKQKLLLFFYFNAVDSSISVVWIIIGSFLMLAKWNFCIFFVFVEKSGFKCIFRNVLYFFCLMFCLDKNMFRLVR